MSQAAITMAFEQHLIDSQLAGTPVTITEMVLADLPDMNLADPIDRAAGLPPVGNIVHRQVIDQAGKINSSAVAYSIVMDTSVGDFQFNAMYLVNADDLVAMVVHKETEQKIKTEGATQGNSLVKSMLMEYHGAAAATQVNVDAGTWQIDYFARLAGMDDDIRRQAEDHYGPAAFDESNLTVTLQSGNLYQIAPGHAYIRGLRAGLAAAATIEVIAKPATIYADVYHAGTLLSDHQTLLTFHVTGAGPEADYIDPDSYQHFVTPLALVNADGSITDLRGRGGLWWHENRPTAHTKAQVGLGNVQNYGLASQAEAEAGSSNAKYMTPLRTRQALDVHANRADNPHGVTKAQLGLGSVYNYGLASQAEAEAGSSHAKYMTPLRTAQAVAKQAVPLIEQHANRGDNPHSVTKDQVGLGYVPNYTVASQAEAEVGAVNNRFMTPLRVKQALAKDPHQFQQNNPHNVTKAQVGLGALENYRVAWQSEAEAGTANNLYMTPLRTRQAVDLHARRGDNPHGVTKAQVGLGAVANYAPASQAEAEAGSSNAKYMTPLRVKQALAKDPHQFQKNNPHNVTKAQVGLGNVQNHAVATWTEAQAGTANDAYMTPLRTKQAVDLHGNRSDNPHNVTKSQVGLGNVENLPMASQAEAEAGSSVWRYMSPARVRQAILALSPQPFPAGTRMLFQQTAAPTGWVKDTAAALNNSALRVVTGAAGNGGGMAFTDAFASGRSSSSNGSHTHPIAVDGHTLTQAEMPAHRHNYTDDDNAAVSAGNYGVVKVQNLLGGGSDGGGSQWLYHTSPAGGGQPHNHGASSGAAGGHQHTLNLNVKYQDIIIAVKQ